MSDLDKLKEENEKLKKELGQSDSNEIIDKTDDIISTDEEKNVSNNEPKKLSFVDKFNFVRWYAIFIMLFSWGIYAFLTMFNIELGGTGFLVLSIIVTIVVIISSKKEGENIMDRLPLPLQILFGILMLLYGIRLAIGFVSNLFS